MFDAGLTDGHETFQQLLVTRSSCQLAVGDKNRPRRDAIGDHNITSDMISRATFVSRTLFGQAIVSAGCLLQPSNTVWDDGFPPFGGVYALPTVSLVFGRVYEFYGTGFKSTQGNPESKTDRGHLRCVCTRTWCHRVAEL